NSFYNAEKHLSLERAAAYSIFYVPESSFDAFNRDIVRNRKAAREAIQSAIDLVGNDRDNPEIMLQINLIIQSHADLQAYRVQLDSLVASGRGGQSDVPDKYFNQVTDLIRQINEFNDLYSR